MNQFDFLKTAFSDYRVGAIAASSRYAVKKVAGNLPSGTKYVVEYGAGEGSMTKGILEALPHGGHLVAVELNHDFWPALKLIKDERLELLNSDVAELSGRLKRLGLPKVDAVVSGIPFSFFLPSVRRKIIEQTAAGLSEGGVFIVYQYSVLVLPVLKKYFREVKISFEPRNFPPYFIMIARK